MKSLLYKTFFDLSQNLLCVFDLDGTLVSYNSSWKQILGYSKHKLMGIHYQKYIHPEDHSLVIHMFDKLKSGDQISPFICRFKDVDGQYKSFEWRVHVKEGKAYALAQDITKRITVDRLLRESDEKFRLIFENSPLGLIHFNKEGVITECNDNFVTILGSSKEKLVGLNMFILPDERVKRAIRSSLDDLETTSIEIEYESYTAKKCTPVRLLFTPIVSQQGTALGGIGIVEDITERVNSEKSLRESKEKYQTLFEQAADGVLIGVVGGTIVDANQNMTLISGYSKDELIGQNITILFTKEMLAEKPLDYQSVLNGQVVHTQRILTRKDGRGLVVEMKTKKLADGRLLSAIRDVTQLKKAEEALKASEDRLKRFFDLNPYSILIASVDGYPLHTNQAFFNLFGSIPSPKFNIFQNSISKRLGIEDELKKALKGETIRIPDFWFKKKKRGEDLAGKVLWIRMVMFPLMNDKGKADMLILMYEDITEQYMLKEKLRHSEKMEALGLLTGGIAHDFNNMLSGIIGGATMLEKHIHSDETRRSLKLITDSAERMTDLTGKLLTFGRKDNPDYKTENINEVIRNAIEILEYSLDKKVEILSEFEAEDMFVKGSVSQLQNVFINLAINASHAMPQGGTITFRTSLFEYDDDHMEMVQNELDSGKYVKIEVADTGMGIPPEYKNKVFEPFFTTKKLNEGAGLGLTTVYGTVKEHKGVIDYVSELNKGSVFSILLPHVSVKEDLPNQEIEAVQSGSGLVLLVDDEELVREATQDMLEALGYQVITAENGLEGYERFVSEKDRIDLVILDMMMPKMNGKECFKKIKAIDSEAKIILYSGYSNMDDVEELKQDGLMAFIKKPFSFAELSKIMKTCE